MLDKKTILNNLEEAKHKLSLKGYDLDLDNLLKLENDRRTLQIKLENLQKEKNEIANDMKKRVQNGQAADQEAGLAIGKEINAVKLEFNMAIGLLEKLMLEMPNIPNEKTPVGKSESDNVLFKTFMEPRNFNFKVKDHTEITKLMNNSLDFDKGVQLAKSRFVVMKDKTARLHRALSQFMLDLHTEKNNYIEVNVPVFSNIKSLTATGQLPKFEDDLFKIEGTEMALIPTAEVPLTNLVAGMTFTSKELPIKMVAHSLCFRSEAGSAGRDVKGILRQHQFEKVELVQIVESHKSEEALLEILDNAEAVLKLLKLPYRVVTLCTGDLGFGSSKTYDIEVWVPSQNTYREISSCSNMTDFQSRRLSTKVKDKENKKEFVHTLNGSGLAIGRTLLAVLENYQNEDGSVTIPDVLIPYMGGLKSI